MKIKINADGYSHLLNDNSKEIFCIKRHPVQTIIADKLGQPVAIEMPTRSSLCGDHCPFFRYTPNEDKSGAVELCHDHIRGISEEIQEDINTNKLKILQP